MPPACSKKEIAVSERPDSQRPRPDAEPPSEAGGERAPVPATRGGATLRATTVLLIAGLGLGLYLFADAQTPAPEAPATTVKRVRVATVEPARDAREVRFSGVTRAVRRARLAFTLGGRVVERPVEVGDRVAAGEVIARLDDRELRNAVATARGSLTELAARRAQSERDLERVERLAGVDAATSEELERVRAAAESLRAAESAAEARLREAERLLDEARLTAPFAGTVTDVHLEPGEFAGPGRAVVDLSGAGGLELRVEVPESVVGRIAEGDEVTVHLPLLDRTVDGRVDSVARSAAGAGSLFPVVASLPPEPGLAAGSTAELVLHLELDDALSVPVEAVVDPGGRRPAVYRLDGVRAAGDAENGWQVAKVEVDVGSLLGDRVSIRGDLEVGDRVVVGGQRGLLDGEAVEVEP
jgi:RND family efflux transporter MFP subunit